MQTTPELVVIDPAVETPELAALNRISRSSPLPVSYHLPALLSAQTLPTKQVVGGIIILGSRSSVNDGLPWQKKMNDWLIPQLEQGIPTLGICYGHQLIAHLFGARIEYRFADRKKLTGFREITFSPNALFDNASKKGSLYVSHGEVVVDIPSSMKVFAKSDEVAIEGLSHLSLPIWTLQPHPEVGPEFAEKRHAEPIPESSFSFGHSVIQAFLRRVQVSAQSNLVDKS